MTTPATAKLSAKVIAALITAVVIGIVCTLAFLQVKKWREDSIAGEQRGAKLETTTGVLTDANALGQQAQQQEGAVAGARYDYTQGTEEETRNDPTFRDYRNEPVRDSVRERARTRRLARQRSGCVGDDCP